MLSSIRILRTLATYLWSKPAPEEQGDDNNAFVAVLETGWSGSLLGTTGTAPSVSFGRAEKKANTNVWQTKCRTIWYFISASIWSGNFLFFFFSFSVHSGYAGSAAPVSVKVYPVSGPPLFFTFGPSLPPSSLPFLSFPFLFLVGKLRSSNIWRSLSLSVSTPLRTCYQ